ncbi:hypothetical protein KI372_07020 [Halobacterium salinarum]|uniref:hypothetical protein n=1 Tax=Halobacterium salinarum TaxID=2242 RepID=UPI001F22513A|nr:hypothetical protein [Halobacterium salinarum]MCF2206489.1 hypothetical protein [Halobacterium salinarum]MCF2241130.1 hypothetical protein [Halobacterium salinarum]
MSAVDPIEAVLSPAQRVCWKACRAPGEVPVQEFASDTEGSKGIIGVDRGEWQVVKMDEHDFLAYMERPVFC